MRSCDYKCYSEFVVVRMEPLQDEVLKLTSEKRKRRKKDESLNLEKDLQQEMLLLNRSKRRNKSAPCSGGSSHCRAYTHDTSLRKGGTTKPKARAVQKQKSTLAISVDPSTDACKFE